MRKPWVTTIPFSLNSRSAPLLFHYYLLVWFNFKWFLQEMFLERPGTLGDSYQILHFNFGIYLWVTNLFPGHMDIFVHLWVGFVGVPGLPTFPGNSLCGYVIPQSLWSTIVRIQISLTSFCFLLRFSFPCCLRDSLPDMCLVYFPLKWSSYHLVKCSLLEMLSLLFYLKWHSNHCHHSLLTSH